MHTQLVQEHLGSALVGVEQLDPGDEPDRTLVLVGDQKMVPLVGEEFPRRLRIDRIIEQRSGRDHRFQIIRPEPLDAHGGPLSGRCAR